MLTSRSATDVLVECINHWKSSTVIDAILSTVSDTKGEEHTDEEAGDGEEQLHVSNRGARTSIDSYLQC